MVCKRFIAIIFIFLFWTIFSEKENFLAKPQKKQQASRSKLKEKIGQNMADLMQQVHKEIELSSQVCQDIFNKIEELVNQEDSKLNSATYKDLESYFNELEKLNLECQNRIENLQKTKKFFKSGCIN